jgi:hypothetical protein
VSQINSLRAYDDCRKLFEAAMADPKGARAQLGEESACINMRTRMHYFRKLDREANEKTYTPGHPQHGTSVYDTLVVRILPDEDGAYWLYVEPRTTDLYIEGLSEAPPLIEMNVMDGESHEVHQIEDKSNG